MHVTEAATDIGALSATNKRSGIKQLPSSVIILFAGIVLAFVVLGPVAFKGWPLLLDFIWGPHQDLPESAWGLGSGITATLPLTIFAKLLSSTLGAFGGWLLIGSIFPLAMWSMARLVKGNLVTQFAAGFLYALNPIVFERLWAGQIGFLLGYAMLPAFAASLLADRSPSKRPLLAPVLWLSVLIGCSAHFLWIGGALIAGVLLTRKPNVRILTWFFAFVLLIGVTNAYLVPSGDSTPSGGDLSASDLTTYATRSMPHVGVLGTVASLYGFWRVEASLPRQDNPGWFFFLAIIAVVSAAGIWQTRREKSLQLPLRAVGVAGVIGLFLACGNQGPIGSVFTWMYDRLPGFAIMREPQKFVSLVALFYAYAFGIGVNALFRPACRKTIYRITVSVAAGLVVIGYTPTMFWAFGGRMHASSYPRAWYSAEKTMPKNATILFLPWHQYMDFSFSHRRLANPAGAFFTQRVISGDNVEIGGDTSPASQRSAYIEGILSQHAVDGFGQLMAPLGVDYVVLSHNVDWMSYSWLNQQRDLVMVYDDPEITVYRNQRAAGNAYVVSGVEAASTITELVNASRSQDFLASASTGSPATTTNEQSTLLHADAAKRKSPVKYKITTNSADYLIFTEPYHSSWKLNNHSGYSLLSGTVMFPIDENSTNLNYVQWSRVRTAYVVSLTSIFAILSGLITRKARAIKHRKQAYRNT